LLISVASGKGGTGKTTVAVNLFLSFSSTVWNEEAASIRESGAPRAQLLDCDVEEPNAHIFLKPEIKERLSVSLPVPLVDENKCSHCGVCAEVCAFNAILATNRKIMVFEELCHGCGACGMFCPEGAISEKERNIGVLETGLAEKGMFSHGILNPGEAIAAPLISAVRNTALGDGIVIIDSPPGTSCSMVESVKGSDFCILVTEPTPFGFHDLQIAYEVTQKLMVPSGVVINRSDIGDDRVERFCRQRGIPVLLKIPFDRKIAVSYARGENPTELYAEYAEMFGELKSRVLELAGESLKTWRVQDLGR